MAHEPTSTLDPFRLLEIPRDADDATVRQAWLAKVRAYPPERAPRAFEAIRTAYETLATERDRLRYQLFDEGPPTLEEVLLALLESDATPEVGPEDIRAVLHAATASP